MAVPVLPYQTRRRALAELDAALAKAERDHAACLALAGRLAAAGSDARAAEGKARVAGARVERLRRSREFLVDGDAGGS